MRKTFISLTIILILCLVLQSTMVNGFFFSWPLSRRNRRRGWKPDTWMNDITRKLFDDFKSGPNTTTGEMTYHYTSSSERRDRDGNPIGSRVSVTANLTDPKNPQGTIIREEYTPMGTFRQKKILDFPGANATDGTGNTPTYSIPGLGRWRVMDEQFDKKENMMEFVAKLKPGEKMTIEGPRGKIEYNGPQNITVNGKQGKN
jgi:hypothetical protein